MSSTRAEQMEAPVFYAPPECLTDTIVRLPAEEGRHAVNVIRLKPADMVIVIDGLGTAYRGEIKSLSADGQVLVRVHSQLRGFGEPAAIVTLAAGLSSGSKFDTVVEKGTELGVKRFVPLVTRKSKVRLDDPRKARARITRLERVALAAAKQCRRSYRPEMSLPVSFDDYIRETDRDSLNLVFHVSQGRTTTLEEAVAGHTTKRLSLLVGPESGFDPDEVEAAVDAGYKVVSLGPRVLRAETAGPTAVALVMHLLGELR
jgi:16S rRNA (uracil1498-N3)-methyltransferase